MWLDVSDLRRFYQTPLGQVARRLIRRQIRAIWPNLAGQRLLAIGYGTPFLISYLDETERVAAIMPAAQGVTRWPPEGPGLVALADEAELPFAEGAFDRVLLVHAVEFSEQLRPMLREIWRILAGGGRLLVVVPNRRGLWARLERTPFGHGHPYSPWQLDTLLGDCMFLPSRAETALYVPPSGRPMMLRLATAWERAGGRWARPFSGVLLVEAEKQVYAATTLGAAGRVPRRRPAAVPGSAFQPRPARITNS